MTKPIFKIQKKILDSIYTQAAAEYPSECCGWILQYKNGEQKYTPSVNLQDKYHKVDSAAYPRTSKDAFLMDVLKLSRELQEAESMNGHLFSIVHSHIDVGAYFSSEDKKQMSYNGEQIYPADCYLVVNVHEARPDSQAVFYFNKEKNDFLEAEILIIN